MYQKSASFGREHPSSDKADFFVTATILGLGEVYKKIVVVYTTRQTYSQYSRTS